MLQLNPGQAVVYHGDRPFTRGFPRGLREMVLTIPEPEFVEAFGVSLDRLPFVFDFGPATGATEQALPRVLSQNLRSGVADGPAVAVAEEQLRALLHRALTSSNSSAVGLVATAKDVIERSYADAGLTVSAVAAAVRISQRQLARAFAEQQRVRVSAFAPGGLGAVDPRQPPLPRHVHGGDRLPLRFFFPGRLQPRLQGGVGFHAAAVAQGPVMTAG